MAPVKTRTRPSRPQLFLAIAIAKSKPPGLSIRQYLAKIRNHVLQGSSAQDYGSEKQYLDAAGYWHTQHQDSQREIDTLQNSLTRAEHQRSKQDEEILQLRNEIADLRTASALQVSSAKRKKPPLKDDGLKHKKLKTIASRESTPQVTRVDRTIQLELENCEDSSSKEAVISRHIYQLHQLYKSIFPDPSALAFHIVKIARQTTELFLDKAAEIQRQLVEASSIHDRRQRAQHTASTLSLIDTELVHTQRAMTRAFTSLFHGLRVLKKQGTEAATRHHGAATYALVLAAKDILATIRKLCEVQGGVVISDDPSQATKSDTPKKAKVLKRENTAPVPQELTVVLLALVSGLDAAQDSGHSAFFEGLLYLLLDRTAELLVLLTFKHDRDEQNHVDLARSTTPALADPVAKATSLEVQFLVQLLQRMMHMAPKFLGAAAVRTITSRPGTATRARGKKTPQGPVLSNLAREKLQRTLLRCMFPRRSEDEEDEFLEILRKPLPPAGALLAPPKTEDIDVPSWFRSEVWQLVGWDLHAREDIL